MNSPATTYPIRPTRHVRPAGTDTLRAHDYQQQPKASFQIRPYFHSNFTGKERDEETGFGYFGARYMDHELMTMWLSVDPMSDKYPSISPYAYCSWNPVKLVDPDGREISPVFTSTGDFRGCTKEGYTGDIIIYDGDEDFKDMSANELISKTSNSDKPAFKYNYKNRDQMKSDEARKKMYFNIFEQANGTNVEGSVFNPKDMDFCFNANGDGNWNTQTNNGGESRFILTATDKYLYWEELITDGILVRGSYEATVENILATVVNHEWYGHFIKKYSDADHYKCYEASKNSPYYSKTTENYKNYIERQIEKLKKP